MPNLEATLFNTLKDLADVTKVNLVQNLNTAMATGELTLDERTLHVVTSIFKATVDGSIDVSHGQVLRVVSKANSKPTKKKTTKKKGIFAAHHNYSILHDQDDFETL